MPENSVIFAPPNSKTLHPYYPHGVTNKDDLARLVSRLNDLDFLAFRVLTSENLPASPMSGLTDAIAYISAGYELGYTLEVLDIAELIRRANHNTAKHVCSATFHQTHNLKMKKEKITGDQITRQHAIPEGVHRFAVMQQLDNKARNGRGRGRGNQINLPEIYIGLVKEGLKIISDGATPIFNEVGRPEGCVYTRIPFDVDTDKELRALKKRADDGEYIITPYSDISLISLAVNLMCLAIEKRQKKK